MSENETLLQANNLKKYFPVETGWLSRLRGHKPMVKAVDDVSLTVRHGETVAVVGESGSGKSTLGRLLLRLIEPTAGEVVFKGQNTFAMSAAELREFRRQVQIVFQDPYASLNPRMRVGDIVREPLDIYELSTPAERRRRVAELLERVGLAPMHAQAYPSALSGGQQQRVGIAAALALSPALIVADEPVSALDVSVQAQILNLLAELQDEYGLAFVFIAHDLSVVQHFSDRVAVMYLGQIVEEAPTPVLFANPQHPYTQMLLSVIPKPTPTDHFELHVPEGEPPSPIDPPAGCNFHPRCPHAMRICREHEPKLQNGIDGTRAACHLLSLEQLSSEERHPIGNSSGGHHVAVTDSVT